MIKEITNNEGKSFLIANKASKEHISITDASLWLGAFEDDKLIGVVSTIKLGSKIRIKEFYVLKDYRGRGIGSSLLENLLKQENSYSAFATEDSFPLFVKFGFIPKRKGKISFLTKS